MRRIIIIDTSSMIDLRKGQLLELTLSLPYRFVVPSPVQQEELLDFTDLEWAMLSALGISSFDLSPEQMAESISINARYSRLSNYDCMCLVLGRWNEGGMLLTGDKPLRRIAQSHNVEVHGVLWIIDELRKNMDGCEERLQAALKIWRDDPNVYLPLSEILKRLK